MGWGPPRGYPPVHGVREINYQNDPREREIWDGRCRERSQRGYLLQLCQALPTCCLSSSPGLWDENLGDGPRGCLMDFNPCGMSRLFFLEKAFCCVPGGVFLFQVRVLHVAGMLEPSLCTAALASTVPRSY